MIKTIIDTKQELSKDEFILRGEYKFKWHLFGIKFFDRTSVIQNTVSKHEVFGNNKNGVGFSK